MARFYKTKRNVFGNVFLTRTVCSVLYTCTFMYMYQPSGLIHMYTCMDSQCSHWRVHPVPSLWELQGHTNTILSCLKCSNCTCMYIHTCTCTCIVYTACVTYSTWKLCNYMYMYIYTCINSTDHLMEHCHLLFLFLCHSSHLHVVDRTLGTCHVDVRACFNHYMYTCTGMMQ